ncbi:MAG: hypothetical protein GY724_14810 [Actinomycetia bacterium]|nr:hypothetical protein [Actinomycetes bacterium]MCP5030739.1 hypothetical protein [Actinomycetes bacterium]
MTELGATAGPADTVDTVVGSMGLGPRTLERPHEAGGTLTGVLAGRNPAVIDGAGLISPIGVAWSLDWWIGGEDRWYLPAREATTRQRRVGAGPVVETMISLPGGSARQLAYGALVGGREVTVVEVYNDSPVPVALGLAVRPYSWTGERVSELTISLDDRIIFVDGQPALVLPRPANDSGGSAGRDLLTAVMAHDALGWDGGVAMTQGSGANAVAIYPLPHKTSLRLLVLGAGTDGVAARRWEPGSGPEPSQAPDGEGVSRGWTSVVNAGGHFEFPDNGIAGTFEGARSRLLLASPTLAGEVAELRSGSGALLMGLALGGHRSEIGPVLDALALGFPTRLDDGPVAGAEVVAAIGVALDSLGRRPWAGLLETAAQIAHLVERAGDDDAAAVARRGLARLATLSGDESGAAHLAKGSGRNQAGDLATVATLMEEASSTGAWSRAGLADDPVAAARFLVAARSLLIDDGGDDLVLLPGFAAAWRGANVELNDVPTRFGRLSFGIRWHGHRPALLWQLDGESPAPTIRCPDLDAEWSTTEARGEALLVGSDHAGPSTGQVGDSSS